MLIGLGVQAVTYFAMALRALHFSLAYVPIVYELRICVLLQFIRLSVAVMADLFGNLACALDSIEVAFPAIDVALKVRLMIEARSAREFDRFCRGIVARRATGNGVLLPAVYAVLEVAKEADTLGDREVCALDDLRMAGNAAEFLAPAQLGEVGCVIEFIFTFE